VQLGLARTKPIPSGVEVMGPEKNIRIRLPKDFTAYDFLKKVIGHSRVDLHTRIAAAVACLPYEKPRLIAVMPSSVGSNEMRIVVNGGLPRLPGSTTIFPGDPPEPYSPPPQPEPVNAAPVEVGTCTVAEPSSAEPQRDMPATCKNVAV
jgi:hypothetical protein